jgi:hypothetical protein
MTKVTLIKYLHHIRQSNHIFIGLFRCIKQMCNVDVLPNKY